MKTILVPHDFSENADNALKYALELAKKSDFEIVLMHVCALPYEFAVRIEEAIESLEDYAKSKLKSIISKVYEDPNYAGIKCKSYTTVGSTVSSIIDYTEKNNISLVVMGTKGASGLAKLLLGSNTAEIIRRSNVPVLAVPAKAAFGGPRAPLGLKEKHMLSEEKGNLYFAIDYENNSLKAIEEAVKAAGIFGMILRTIHVAPKDNLVEEMRHLSLKKLLEEKFPNAFESHELIYHKTPREGLILHISNNKSSIYIIPSHTKTSFNLLFNESVSQDLIYQIQTPILIINEPG